MRVSLLELSQPGDNKEYNGGYGTKFEPGHFICARLLRFVRTRTEYFSALSVGYLMDVLRQAGHSSP